jgi:hypothetical protein
MGLLPEIRFGTGRYPEKVARRHGFRRRASRSVSSSQARLPV